MWKVADWESRSMTPIPRGVGQPSPTPLLTKLRLWLKLKISLAQWSDVVAVCLGEKGWLEWLRIALVRLIALPRCQEQLVELAETDWASL